MVGTNNKRLPNYFTMFAMFSPLDMFSFLFGVNVVNLTLYQHGLSADMLLELESYIQAISTIIVILRLLLDLHLFEKCLWC